MVQSPCANLILRSDITIWATPTRHICTCIGVGNYFINGLFGKCTGKISRARLIFKLKLAYFFWGYFWWKLATCAVRKCNKSAKTRECRNYAIKKELGRENTRWKGECQMHVYWHNGPYNGSGAQPLPVFRKFSNIFFFSWICGEEYKMSRILLSRRVLHFVLSKYFL